MISSTRFVRNKLPSRVCTRFLSDSTTDGVKVRKNRKGVISQDRYKIDILPENPFPDALVHRTAEMEHGARQYFLLLPNVRLIDALTESRLAIASIFTHDSLIFGARLHHIGRENPENTIANVCPPLLEAASRDAVQHGLQPQALSTLYGLCDWVVDCLEGRQQSEVLDTLLKGEIVLQRGSTGEGITADSQLQAIRAIATRTPRPGHKVVGKRTFAMGEDAWIGLAKEFVIKKPSEECILYKTAGAELVEIEHLADAQPKYIASAGGAMARFVFI